jgi:Fic family protein
MNPDWFRNSPAGTVVEVNDPDVTYWAYVPKPLPTSLAMSPELVKLLAQAADAIGELRGLGRRLLSAKLLVGPLVRREAVDSSRIEGTKTNVVELYAYEAQNVRVYQSRRSRGLHLWPRKRSDAQEVLN